MCFVDKKLKRTISNKFYDKVKASMFSTLRFICPAKQCYNYEGGTYAQEKILLFEYKNIARISQKYSKPFQKYCKNIAKI